MPFSRRPQRRAFSGSSRRRFRGLRSAQDLRRWEYSNFRITAALSNPTGNQTTTIVALAQVIDHLADSGSIPGALEAFKIRAIEVGGIVFSSNVFLNQAPLVGISAHAIFDFALFVDRLGSSGSPNTIYPFNINTPPVVAANNVNLVNQELAFPTRTLWRETRVLPVGASDVGLAHPQTYYSGSRSLRLKLRLKDDFGLFFAHGCFQSTGVTFASTGILSGGLYWRTAYR